jgi:hypothetical protein
MTSSTSSSSRTLALLAGALAACAAVPPPPVETAGPAARVLVLPPENLTGRSAPLRELMGPVERALAVRGVDVLTGAQLEEWLARYRIRYTGGVDGVAAAAAREELGADGVLVTSLQLYDDTQPSLALTLRLVSTGPEPAVLWIDGYARTFDDAPGFMSLGIVGSLDELREEGLSRLADSMLARLEGRGPVAPACPGGGWFRPRIAYEAVPDRRQAASVAVLPFVNLARRRSAGELVALEFTRQLAAAPGFRVVEPGLVRDVLLKRRIVMEEGVSLDQARTLTNALDADLVVAGYVFGFDDGPGLPTANFTVLVIDRRSGRVVWESTSFNRGTDSESLFATNRVSTGSRLTCRMVRNVVAEFAANTVVPRR